MANVIWIGNAPTVAQVDLLTVGGTIETDDVFTMTINSKDLDVVGGSATAATVATNIATAWNASTEPEFAEITADASAADGTLLLTADTAGVPFTVTVTTTEDGGGTADSQTFQRAASVANGSPNDVANVKNWSGGALPTGSDDVYAENSSVSMLYGLGQYSAVAFNSFTILNTYTGKIGLPERNANGYNEYRETYFLLAATTLAIGEGGGSGSQRLKFNFGSTQMTANVWNTSTDAEAGVMACLLKSTHASAAATVYGGRVGIAGLAGETSTVALTQRGGVVYLGGGATVKTVTKTGGTLTADAVATSGSETLTLR